MAKYKKKPVEINAWKFEGPASVKNVREFTYENNLPAWNVGSYGGVTGIVIPTLEGRMIAEAGDFIIQGVNGEYYPCKPNIFEKTYDSV